MEEPKEVEEEELLNPSLCLRLINKHNTNHTEAEKLLISSIWVKETEVPRDTWQSTV
jgi:hypothetical protein